MSSVLAIHRIQEYLGGFKTNKQKTDIQFENSGSGTLAHEWSKSSLHNSNVWPVLPELRTTAFEFPSVVPLYIV